MEKRLSFVVPAYNAERYLSACLDALLAQDREDYEILCVNDGSSDATPDILDAYGAKDPRVRVFHKSNGGVTTARNMGLKEAKGEYIWFVDADDLLRPNILGKLWDAIADGSWDRIVVDAYTFVDELPQPALNHAEDLPRNTPWQDAVVWRNLLRRQFLLEHNLHFAYPELTHGEDGLFMYEVASAGPKTLETGTMTYFYRVHSGSAETSVSLTSHRKKLRSFLRLTEIMDHYYKEGRKDAVTANKLMSYLWLALYESAHLPVDEAKQALERLGALGLYPGKPLPQCSMTSAYLMGGPGFVGKMLDYICMHLQSPWAYHTLRLLLKLKG